MIDGLSVLLLVWYKINEFQFEHVRLSGPEKLTKSFQNK